MRLLREEGQIRAYSDRGSNKRTTRKDDPSELDAFINKSKDHKNLLKMNSDIVRRLNKKRRKEAEENERKKQVEEEKERERDKSVDL